MASKRETQKLSIGKAKVSIQRPRPDTVIRKGLAEVLPTSVQKSYFMLTDAEGNLLNTALEKYRPGQSEPILVGGENLLKPALRLMTWYRLVIERVFKMTLDWRTDDAASDALAQSLKGPPYDQKWLTN
jgi:hypothetical protein